MKIDLDYPSITVAHPTCQHHSIVTQSLLDRSEDAQSVRLIDWFVKDILQAQSTMSGDLRA